MEPFGEYLLVERLGAGAMGDVHLAQPIGHRDDLPEWVIVKRLHAHLLGREILVERFRQEAQVAALIDSPYVAQVYDVGRVGDVLFYAGELVPGWSFSELLEALFSAGGRLPIPIAIALACGAALGIRAIHEVSDPATGVRLTAVHRDLSPRNLMVDVSGRARVIDLGLLKSAARDWHTKTGSVMGTPGYMAPEQALGQPIDQSADVYALAVVLFELLTFEPYIPPNPVLVEHLRATAVPLWRAPSTLRRLVPPEVDALLERALNLNPASRPSAAAFAETLGSLGAAESEVADFLASTLPVEHAHRLSQRHGAVPRGDRTSPGRAPLGSESVTPVETFVRVRPRAIPPAATTAPLRLDPTVALERSPSRAASGGRGFRWYHAAAAALAALVAVALLSWTILEKRAPASMPAALEEPQAPAVVFAPQARARPLETTTATKTAAPAVPSPRPRPRAEARVERTPSSPRPSAAPEPTAPSAQPSLQPVEALEADLQAAQTRLRRRARALLRSFPDESPRKRQLDGLLARLAMESERSDIVAKAAAFREIAQELDRLEAQGRAGP